MLHASAWTSRAPRPPRQRRRSWPKGRRCTGIGSCSPWIARSSSSSTTAALGPCSSRAAALLRDPLVGDDPGGPGIPHGRRASGRARRLRVGIQLPEVERVVRWPEIRAMARLAEDAGFDSLWVGDHLLYREEARGVRGPWEAWTSLAGLAEATSRIALGPLVAATAFHAPAMLAKMA